MTSTGYLPAIFAMIPFVFGSPSWTTSGSIDAMWLFLCKSNASFTCSSSATGFSVYLNDTPAVVCVYDGCTKSEDFSEKYVFEYDFSAKHITTKVSVGIIELHTNFTCTDGNTRIVRTPRALVYPLQSQSELTANVSSDRANIVVTTGCMLLNNTITFLWQKTKNRDGRELEPFTMEDAVYRESATTTDNRLCIPSENCGGTGMSKYMSFKAGTAGDKFHIHCTIVVSNNQYPSVYNDSVTLISNLTFQFTIPVSSVNLTVAKPGQVGSTLTVEENNDTTVICTSSYSRPKAVITLHGISVDARNCNTNNDSNGLISTTCQFTFKVSRGLNKAFIYCNGTNTNEELSSQTVALNVLYPPSGEPHIQKVNTSISVIETQLYNLTCLISDSNPATRLSWSCADSESLVQELTPNSAILSFIANRTMTSTCTCSSNYRNSSRGSLQITINTLYPVSITRMYFNDTAQAMQLAVMKVIENSTLTIKYDTDGNPAPAVTWYPSNTTSSVLTLSNIQRTLRNKVYVFRASNTMTDSFGFSIPSDDNKTLTLDVLYAPEVKTLQNNSIIEGRSLSVSCDVQEGNPVGASVSWTNMEDSHRVLNISRVNRSDENWYQCAANTTLRPSLGGVVYGFDAKKFFLQVLYPPEKMIISTNVPQQPVSDRIDVIEDTFLQLHCSATGQPPPTNITWSGRYSSPTSNIPLQSDRSKSGNLTCSVSNQMTELPSNTTTLGSAGKSVFLNVLYPPTAKDVNITKDEGEDVNVTCLENHGNVSNLTVCWEAVNINNKCDYYLWMEKVARNATGNYNCTVNYILSPTYGLNKSRMIEKVVSLNVLAKGNEESKPGNDAFATGATVGGALAGVAVILAIVAALYIIQKRRALSPPVKVLKQPEYENVSILPDKKEKNLPPFPTCEELEEVNDTSNNAFEPDVCKPDDNPYMNQLEMAEIKKISISELFMYVTNKPQENFLEEFEKLPKGVLSSIPYTAARKPENVKLNRYQGIYPYDHSRVTVIGQPDFFINANYINGFKKSRQYIASLGPTKRHTLEFKTFWNMVWHEQSDIIVMLTNLSEPSGMKCEKYWADFGKTIDVGDFVIKSETEEVTAEYTVRTFSVSKDKESRFVTQLHYTAWPDKTVPDSVTSLIDFRQRVRAAPTQSLGPVIVHCSAGIGRTGTYIALDRLIEEGRSTGFVNVYDCVMDMRQQRVNMVQTMEQYVYLHQALVYCLTFNIEPLTDDAIREYTLTASNNSFSQSYQELKQTVEKETDEYLEARGRHESFVELNRRKADIPGDRHRVLLSLDKAFGESNYINAVYLSSFRRLDHFIIAQSPVPKTVDDFVGMLYQEKSICIVSMDDYKQKGTNNVTYLPAEKEQFTYGLFTISCSSVDVRTAYIIRKVKLAHAGKHEQGERIAYHFEFTAWRYDEQLPKDPKMFLEFVREVEEFSILLKEKDSHVVVHCMTGSERSGLFCAVSNLIQKMELEKQVSVVNTLRRVRERRKTAIPAMEQMKFCYQALNTFVKQPLQQRSREKLSMVHYENNVD